MKTRLTKIILSCLLMVVGLSAMAINPERGYKFTPDMRGFDYSEYQVKTVDGFSINVWEYRLPDSVKATRTIILAGTDAGNMGYLIWQAAALLSKGVRVVAFDYRGFGNSDEFEINHDFLFYPEFAKDLDAVIRSTRLKFPADKLGVYAMSMGTHISLLATEKMDFLIAEGFYHDPKKVVERLKAKGESVLLPPDSRVINKMNNGSPILIFCASQDSVTTTGDAREFAKRNHVSIVEFKGDHLRGMLVLKRDDYGDLYVERILEFLNRE